MPVQHQALLWCCGAHPNYFIFVKIFDKIKFAGRDYFNKLNIIMNPFEKPKQEEKIPKDRYFDALDFINKNPELKKA